MMVIKEVLLQWFKRFMIKNPLVVMVPLQINLLLKIKMCQQRISQRITQTNY